MTFAALLYRDALDRNVTWPCWN